MDEMSAFKLAKGYNSIPSADAETASQLAHEEVLEVSAKAMNSCGENRHAPPARSHS